MPAATPLDTVQALYAAFARGDVPAMLARLAEDVEWRFVGAPDVPYSGTVRGHPGFAGWLADVAAQDDIEAFEPRRFLAGPDHVTVIGWERTRARPTGRVFEVDWVHVLELRDGRICRFLGLYDTARAAIAFAPTR